MGKSTINGPFSAIYTIAFSMFTRPGIHLWRHHNPRFTHSSASGARDRCPDIWGCEQIPGIMGHILGMGYIICTHYRMYIYIYMIYNGIYDIYIYNTWDIYIYDYVYIYIYAYTMGYWYTTGYTIWCFLWEVQWDIGIFLMGFLVHHLTHPHETVSCWKTCRCPAWQTYKKLWNITIFHGQINYFDWAIFNSHVRLPEGNCRYGKKRVAHERDLQWRNM